MAVARIIGKAKQRREIRDLLKIYFKMDSENVFRFAHELYDMQDDLFIESCFTKADIDEILEEIIYA